MPKAATKSETHWDGKTISPAQWGRDHLSTMLYAESCAVDRRGEMDPRKLRQDDDFPTRLSGGVKLTGHTDIDCLSDMHDAGLLVTTGLAAMVKLTPKGWSFAAALRRNRADTQADAKFDVAGWFSWWEAVGKDTAYVP